MSDSSVDSSASSVASSKARTAAFLSRLAALQGHAVPRHRFSMLETNRDGADLSSLSLTQQAEEMWLGRFPLSQTCLKESQKLEKGAFPLLWVNDETSEMLFLTGRLASGAMIAENDEGETRELDLTEAQSGSFLHLGQEPQEPEAKEGATAKDGPSSSASKLFVHSLRKKRRVFAEAIFATLIMNVLGLFAAFYTMQVYDRVVPTKSFSTLWVLTVGVLIAVLFEFAMRQVRSYMMERATTAIDLELSGIFFGKALDIRLDERPATVGTFAAQIRQFDSVRNFMGASVLFVFADAPFAVLFIGVVAIIGGYVALVPLILVPVAILMTLVLRGQIEHYSEENMTESNIKNGLLIEAVDGIESVKATGGEWKMQDRYRDLVATIASSDIKLKLIGARASNFSIMIQQINHVGLIAVGAYAVTEESLTLGGLIACAILMGRVFTPLSQIPNLVMQWKQAKISLKNLDRIMALPGERNTSERLIVPDGCQGELALKNATFGYLSDRPTIVVPEIRFRPSERVAVLGAVGSGKSTFIKLLAGLYKPREGGLYLDGIDVQQIAPEFIREQIGYLPQDVRLFNGSLRENLTMGLPTPSDSRILEATKLTGLEASIKAHPRGLELQITEGGRGLSGGQRQLVGLTRLLLAKPKILLMDEPTASMDSQNEAQVIKHLFEEMPSESLLVMVTHKMSLLKHVQRIIVLDKGRVVVDGPRDEVMAKIRHLQSVAAKKERTM